MGLACQLDWLSIMPIRRAQGPTYIGILTAHSQTCEAHSSPLESYIYLAIGEYRYIHLSLSL